MEEGKKEAHRTARAEWGVQGEGAQGGLASSLQGQMTPDSSGKGGQVQKACGVGGQVGFLVAIGKYGPIPWGGWTGWRPGHCYLFFPLLPFFPVSPECLPLPCHPLTLPCALPHLSVLKRWHEVGAWKGLALRFSHFLLWLCLATPQIESPFFLLPNFHLLGFHH
jgi:hypothetical protein